jgi:hypothetical protein
VRDSVTGNLAPVDLPAEYGIQLADNDVIVGPGWASHADVVDSFHAFNTDRVYGTLVVRTKENPQWLPAAK